VSEHDLKVYGSLGQKPGSNVYLQYKIWWGRTATGGGTGSDAVGSFAHYNLAEGYGHKMAIVRRLRADGSGGGARIDLYAGVPERQGISGYWYNDAAAGSNGGDVVHYSAPLWNPNANLNRVVTVTMRLKSESSPSANDGVMQVWMNGTLTIDLTNADFGTDGWDQFEIGGPTWICPTQDQTSYVWDVVAWRR
ncbi:MAG TPA: hypothetical protein VF541_00945, partial [Longimicrobium sp.]